MYKPTTSRLTQSLMSIKNGRISKQRDAEVRSSL